VISCPRHPADMFAIANGKRPALSVDYISR
jgi:hypothetical protein